MRPPAGRAAVLLLAGALSLLTATAAVGQLRTTPFIEIYLGAWYPQSGPPPEVQNPQHQRLLDMAHQALRGNYAAAEDSLRRVSIEPLPDAATQLLARLFERELVERREQAVESTALGVDRALRAIAVRRRVQSLGDEIARATSQLAPADQYEAVTISQLSSLLRSCGTAQASFLRQQRWLGPVTIPGIPAVPPLDCPTALHTALQGLSWGTSPRGRLLEMWAQVATLQAQGDLVQARHFAQQAHEAAASAGWLQTARLWLLRRGDLEAAPEGSVLTLGDDLASRGAAGGQSLPAGARPPMEPSCNLAEAWYHRAQKIAGTDEDLAIRSAYLTYCQGDATMAAGRYRAAAELSHRSGAVIVEAVALAAEALLTGEPEPYSRAVDLAARAHNPGLLASLAEMARRYCEREAAGGDLLGAARRLAFALFILSDQQQDLAAAELEAQLASLCFVLRLDDAHILWLERAAQAYRAHLARAEQANREEPIVSPFTDLANVGGAKISLSSVLSSLWVSYRQRALPLDRSDREIWIRRQRAIEEELAGLGEGAGILDPLFLPTFEKMTRRLTLQANLTQEVWRQGGCAAFLQNYAEYRSDLLAAGDTQILRNLDLQAAQCDPAHRARFLAELARLEPIATIRQAFDRLRSAQLGPAAGQLAGWEARSVLQLALSDALSELQGLLETASALSAPQLLQRWLDEAETLFRSEPSLRGLAANLEPYRALVAVLQGTPEGARQAHAIVARILAHPALASPQNFGLRLWLRQLEIEASALLGEADLALVTYEQLRSDAAWRVRLRTGLRPDALESSELAMLLRSASRGDTTGEQSRQLEGLLARAPLFTAASRVPQGADVEQALASLPSGSTLLAYYGDSRGAFVWRKDAGRQTQLFRLPVEPVLLTEKLRRFQDALQNQEEWQTLAAELYAALVAPAGPLAPGTTLVVTGSDFFGGIPFEALKGPDGLLVHRHPVVYVNQLSWDATEVSSAPPSAVGLVLGIDLTDRDLREAEAVAVAQALGVEPLLGEQATLRVVEATLPAASWVHMATEGEIDEGNPYLSSLLLSGGQKLQAWQLFGRASKAEIFVLSACDTQRAATSLAAMLDPEGRRSALADLAFTGGARRVLASLWKAEEDSTWRLMRDTYSIWRREGVDFATALQRARLALLEHGDDHPHAFANFPLTVRDPRFILLPARQSGGAGALNRSGLVGPGHAVSPELAVAEERHRRGGHIHTPSSRTPNASKERFVGRSERSNPCGLPIR